LTRYLIAALIVAVVLSTAFALQPNEPNPAAANPVQVLEGYLKASYARDYRTAYTYIAERDQRVWGRDSYARRNGSLSGFALALARKLAAPMQVWTINRKAASDRVHYEIGYSVPTGDELSSALLEWDEKKLNRLSGSRQQQLMDRIEALGLSFKAVKMNGRESFDLIRENGEWRIFYDWASANKVKVKLAAPRGSGINVLISGDEFMVKKSEPFDVNFTLTNRGHAPASVRLVHHIEPGSAEQRLEMIACGALLPITLQPGASQEITMSYLLTSGIRSGRQIELAYQIQAQSVPRAISSARLIQRERNLTLLK
jgi:hypothetical protein